MTDSAEKDIKHPAFHAIIVAAGQGARAGLGQPKQFQIVAGKQMIRHSVERFLDHPALAGLWIIIGEGQGYQAEQALAGLSGYRLVTGGATRQQSVQHGLAAIAEAGGAGQVLIHDAARPFLPAAVIDRLLGGLVKHDGVIPVLPTTDTMINVVDGCSAAVVDRNTLWRVQTPQAFDFAKLYAAYQQAAGEAGLSDDAQLFRAAGFDVAVVDGDERLRKYTLPSDFNIDQDRPMPQIRTAMGFDVHRLAAGEELWLGGIKIAHDKGLVGHSDADVLLHALTDALLGTIGAGDIGDHFPPSDPQWRGAASHRFVEYAAELISARDGIIQNVDLTIICEAPKIKPYREAIRDNIAELLALDKDQVSVKATTTEQLGFTGRGEGVAAQAIATIKLGK